MIRIGYKYEFTAVVKEYDGDLVSVAVEVHALGETQAREELAKQGYTNVKLIEATH